MNDFIKEAASCDVSNRASSSRVVAIMAGASLSVTTLVLTFATLLAVAMKIEAAVVSSLAGVLMVLAPSLAGLAGASYVTQKIVTGKKETTDEQ